MPTRLAEIAEVELTRADQAMRQNQDFAIGAVRIKDVLTPLTLQAQQTRIAMRMRLRKAFESICQFRCSGTTCHSFLSRSSNLALATHAIDVLVRRRMFFPIHPFRRGLSRQCYAPFSQPDVI